MLTLLIAVGAFFGYLIAYHTYGRWLSKRIFGLDEKAEVPSKQLQDNVDFVPTKRSVIFGHHFTSIAGTGPIVGPAIAVFWGWLPALLWVIFGSIFVGAVHDFGALVVSLRNRGQTVGEVAGRLINPRARVLFLLVLFFALTIVLAIFGLVIATIFKVYPESVLSTWIVIPLAFAVGYWVYRRGGGLLMPSIVGLIVLYGAIYLGVYGIGDYSFAVSLPVENPIVVWTIVLMVYCFFASVLPVWMLLQPRDYINSHQLFVAMGLLMVGLVVAGGSGAADLNSVPAVAENIPAGAPPIWPFLFITIACGACSGFHCLVSSGTSSKQVSDERHAQSVGYGAMLLEGGLAVMVILACCAGLSMGVNSGGETLTGTAAWESRYDASAGWGGFKLQNKVGAFVEGGANFLTAIGIDHALGIGIIAVLVACFAATTLDTATRLQRYVIQELGSTLKVKPLCNKYTATFVAIALGLGMAMLRKTPESPAGTGGLILWPLFGATNQLLAGLAFLVLVFYLGRRSKPIAFAAIPLALMLFLPGWAIGWNLFNADRGWFWPLWSMLTGDQPFAWHQNHLLFGIGLATLALQMWMVVESLLLWPKVRGVLEDPLPQLPSAAATLRSGPNC